VFSSAIQNLASHKGYLTIYPVHFVVPKGHVLSIS
jgi:hypothetical protein